MEVSGQFHTPAALVPGERAPGTRSIEGWMVLQIRSGCGGEKIPTPIGNRIPVVQSIA
jgi:hypothetical protein